jgi:hypothetical protein
MLLLASCPAVYAQKLEVTFDKKLDFTKFKTYAWGLNNRAFDPALDKHIVAAIDQQLAALGLTRVEGKSADVNVAYGAVERTDVDLKKFDDNPEPGQSHGGSYSVGMLLVRMFDAKDKVIWRGLAEKALPADKDKAKVMQAVDEAVMALFAKYPTRGKK